ncbi:MAG: response regulator [Dehalococcoidia bacterium]
MPDIVIRVLLVDDNSLFRHGLATLLSRFADIEVVADLASGEEAVAQLDSLRPDVILMDLGMPGIGGVEAARRILGRWPSVSIAMLTASEADEHLFAAVRAGARGYLTKSVDLETVHGAILTLAAGGAQVTPHLATRLTDAFARMDPMPERRVTADIHASPDIEQLTEREREVLILVTGGLENEGIARQLCISPNTVKVHLTHIVEKLKLKNRYHAAAFAVQEGLVRRPIHTNGHRDGHEQEALSDAELAAQEATVLPDRDVISLVFADVAIPVHLAAALSALSDASRPGADAPPITTASEHL